MYYFTSTDFLITLFGFLSCLDFNNRFGNLTLMTKFRGAPYFRGAMRQCLFCLQVAPALIPIEAEQSIRSVVPIDLSLSVSPSSSTRNFVTPASVIASTPDPSAFLRFVLI